jgi:hypothetical protein
VKGCRFCCCLSEFAMREVTAVSRNRFDVFSASEILRD